MRQAGTQYEGGHRGDEWIVDIEMALGCAYGEIGRTGSICRVPEKIRPAEDEDKEYRYRPRHAAMGPFHRGTRNDLQFIELTKWQHMHHLFEHRTQNKSLAVKSCSEAMKGIGSIIRASYGEKIDMPEEELARIMLLDGCFLLEFLLRFTTEQEARVDTKYMLRVLTDLTLLENQIPFVVLTTLSSILFEFLYDGQLPRLRRLLEVKSLSPHKLAKSLLKCNVARADFPNGVYHFLHLIHLSSPDPYQDEERRSDPLPMQRSARKLQALGITIKAEATQTNDSPGNDKSEETAASVLRKFVDKFEFKIEFNEEERALKIPTLHIKETTEVKWRNLIAWEQIGLTEIGYKFTSYAYFFKGLVCSVHDLKLLKQEEVIKVHNEAIKDEDLVDMLQSITTGAERRDGRYSKICKILNKAEVNGVVGRCVLVFRMPWHYWRRFVEGTKFQFFRLAYIFLGTAWRKAGIFSGIALFGLTITQTVYAIRAVE
ncbi:UPF0481 protein At3g47200-like [Neltuma alba]|uniref:UPF0481 protein At3g47200-like n=1 Tax=Neltuma alba TaxID=207710 RepID=UPI0010A434EE|nr:UPF0481 protein At3g47200-like [Prosopis alba]